MDLGGVFFFGFLGAIIIVPQVLRYKERGRLHQTLRTAFERGQPVPPEVIAALRWGRRRYSEYDIPPEVYAGWQPRPPEAPTERPAGPSGDPSPAVMPQPAPLVSPVFASQTRRDFRRGLIWLAIGLGLVAAGGAFYAGLYDVGGAPETFSSFAALAAVPIFVGLVYLALAWFGRDKTKV
jgi:hypothetical protein